MPDTQFFKVATLTGFKDAVPKVTEFSIATFVQRIALPRAASADYATYHDDRLKAKALAKAFRIAQRAAGADIEDIRREWQAAELRTLEVKDGPALMAYHFKSNRTWHAPRGFKQRYNENITHWSLVMLDIESGITQADIQAVLHPFEYVLWPTVSHRPNDPRFRVVLFPESPLLPHDAIGLIQRIDAHLPERYDATKKLQAIDSASVDSRGRLMYFPAYPANHPEPYFHVHQRGRLITATDLPLDAAQVQRMSARTELGAQMRAKATVTRRQSIPTQASDQSLVIRRGDQLFLNPDGYVETQEGLVRVGSVTRKIGGVACPLHSDINGSEFITYARQSENVYLRCKHCGTVWADKGDEAAPSVLLFNAKPQVGDESKVPRQITRPEKMPAPIAEPGPLQMVSPIVVYINDRFLPSDLNTTIPQAGIVMIKSPKGTGKTSPFLRNVVQDCRRQRQPVHVVGHRVNLLRELASPDKLNLDFYLDIENGETSNYMAICMDSTPRLLKKRQKLHTVIIDESEQVWRHVMSDTLERTRSRVVAALTYLLRESTRVICLDADMTTELTLEMLMQFRMQSRIESEPHFGLINQYKFSGRTTDLYSSWQQLLAHAVGRANQGGLLFISTNHKSKAVVMAQLFKEMGKKTLLVSADTTQDDPDAVRFMENTTAESVNYEVVIATPTAQTGISIDSDHFTDVYGFFWSNVGTFQDIDQALSRVRRSNHQSVWIQSAAVKDKWVPAPLGPTEERVYDKAMIMLGDRRISIGEANEVTKNELTWASVHARVKFLELEWSRDKLQQFCTLRRENGYVLQNVEIDKVEHYFGKELFDTAEKTMVTVSEAALIWDADVLKEEAYEELRSKTRKTRAEHFALQRHRYRARLERSWNLETLTRAVEQDLLANSWKLKQMCSITADELANLDKASLKFNALTFTDASTLVINRELFHAPFEAAGINLGELVAAAGNAAAGKPSSIEVTKAQLLAVARTFESRASDYAMYTKARIRKPTEDKNLIKVWNALYKDFLPLQVKKVQRNRVRVILYVIDWAKCDQVLHNFPAIVAYGEMKEGLDSTRWAARLKTEADAAQRARKNGNSRR